MVANKRWAYNGAIKLFITIGLAAFASFSNSTPLYYYDGGVKRSLQIDTEQWASTKNGVSGAPIEIRKGSSAEKNVLNANNDLATKSEKAALKSMPGSPVFRSLEGGTPMALPGGVIVKQKVGSESAEKILKARGLVIDRAIGDSGSFLVRSPEGISSLELANQLHESGDFESVSPNWWRERRKK
jgi:hypothetical protein